MQVMQKKEDTYFKNPDSVSISHSCREHFRMFFVLLVETRKNQGHYCYLGASYKFSDLLLYKCISIYDSKLLYLGV